MTRAESMTTVGCFLHSWEDVNPEQHRSHISFERRGGAWSNRPMSLTVPAGWEVKPSNGGSLELYAADGRHVQFVRLAAHGKSAEFAWAGGQSWFALAPGESVCCPTCGHPL
jgi:hypothetical protein